MPLPSIQLIHIWTVKYEAHKYKGCFFDLVSSFTLIGKGEGYLGGRGTPEGKDIHKNNKDEQV